MLTMLQQVLDGGLQCPGEGVWPSRTDVTMPDHKLTLVWCQKGTDDEGI